MSVSTFKSEHELLHALADYFIYMAERSILQHKDFNVALAGGNSPKKLYELLASVDYRKKIQWGNVNFFFGDERYVPDDDAQRNSLMAQKTLFDPLHIAPSRIFKVDTSLPPDDAAKKYNETIVKHFNQGVIEFDLILLGLGNNSHTASLFPHTAVLHETTAAVKAVFVEELNAHRITMTAPLINQAKHIAFLVFGKEKAEAIHHVLNDEVNVENYPAQLIKPINGDVRWFLDYAAASRLELPKD